MVVVGKGTGDISENGLWLSMTLGPSESAKSTEETQKCLLGLACLRKMVMGL